LTLEELHEAARKRGYRSLSDLAWVIVESDGKFSFIERPPDDDADHRDADDAEGGHG
jgi:uncharacterized membrane protein YcaP (DUF421 family)